MRNKQQGLAEWGLLRFSLHWVYTGAPLRPGLISSPYSVLRAWWLHQGSLRIRAESSRREHNIEAGHWVFLPVRPHVRSFSEDALITSIWFCANWPDGSSLFDFSDVHFIADEKTPKLNGHARRLERSAQKLTGIEGRSMRYAQADLPLYMKLEQLTAAWIEAYAQCLMGMGIEPQVIASENMVMDEVHASIESWPLNQPLDRETIAAQAGLSVSHMESQYVAIFGKTPRQAWNEYRMQFAKEFIVRSARPVKQLAHELGFTDLAQFSNWFRHHFGDSPRNYRDRWKTFASQGDEAP